MVAEMGVKYEFSSYREICSSPTLLGDPSLHEARRSNEDGWFLFKTENTDTNSISNKIFPISGKSCAVRTQGCHAFKGTGSQGLRGCRRLKDCLLINWKGQNHEDSTSCDISTIVYSWTEWQGFREFMRFVDCLVLNLKGADHTDSLNIDNRNFEDC